MRFHALLLSAAALLATAADPLAAGGSLNRDLQDVLDQLGFTGDIESTVPSKMGRQLDPDLVDVGRLLFFDDILSLHNDNGCAGCHSPAFAFGDPQSMAYGVNNNRIVGPNRDGTRNERRSPTLTNVGFYSKLMVNGRFEANSGDPFDNSQGFKFPAPDDQRFPPNDPLIPNLLTAQAFLPTASLVEMAGFQGTAGTIGPRFDQFDDGIGTPVPPPDANGSRTQPVADLLAARVAGNPEYAARFEAIFGPGPILYEHVGQALAEFQISLLAADAPIDRFARGKSWAMTRSMKRGALLFFGEAGCVTCHAVSGQSNEMFSDFENHNIGVPQISPEFGVGKSNIIFDGPGEDEDFGRERISGDPADRYAFRTSPLRNAALQPAFFHNGAFTTLEDAIAHHLDVVSSVLDYDPAKAGVDEELHTVGPSGDLLAGVDPLLQAPTHLTSREFRDLVKFVRWGLLDWGAFSFKLCQTLPDEVPSGSDIQFFEGCFQRKIKICLNGTTFTAPSWWIYFYLNQGATVGSCNQG